MKYALIALLASATAIDLSAEAFKNYPGVKKLAGVHQIKKTRSTPPSKTTQLWYINLVDPDSKDSKKEIDIEGCPSGSQICGLTNVDIDGKEVTTEIFSFSNQLNPKFNENVDRKHELVVALNGANWGDSTLNAALHLVCSKKSSSIEANFDYETLKVKWTDEAFCTDSDAGGDDDGDDDDNDDDGKRGKHHKKPHSGHESWGWFTWLFILVVLALAGYIIGQAWINTTRMGNSSEFFNELGDSLVETVGKAPEFLKQVATKVTGGADRGGYSAV